MKKNKLITTITVFTILTLSQICVAFGTTTASSEPHSIDFMTNEYKICDKCGKPMPVNRACLHCNK